MNVNSIRVARDIQTRFQELTGEFRHEDDWDAEALAALPWEKLPKSVQDHFATAVTGVLHDLLPKIRTAAIEGATTQQE